jgi:phage repressor protein C with HTH and peptisase S24 domain
MPNDPRKALERLCAERGEDFAGLSRFLGKNPAYIQQYIRRGTPKRLKEEERRKLARYFGVSEIVLGGLPPGEAPSGGLVPVKRVLIRASAGPGALADQERSHPYFGFDERWLRGLSGSPAEDLSIIRVEGDSMAPTLADGDEILVDGADATGRLRDGIYVLRLEGALMVKRLAFNPAARTVTIRSDNPAYPSWADCDPAKVELVGRAVWVGRRLT